MIKAIEIENIRGFKLRGFLHFPEGAKEIVLEESFVEKLKDLNPDIIVVVAFGQILPKSIIVGARWM